jgi:hypothetical protein
MLLLITALASAATDVRLRTELEPLSFLVGHCWVAEFPNKPGERDTQCFESVFNGQHVRSRHEVTGAARPYLGETLFSYDGRSVIFTYWNSLGGVSRGSMRAEGDLLSFGDENYTGADGRRITFSTKWRRIGEDEYQTVTTSPEAPSMNRTMRYRRKTAPAAQR